MRIASLLPDFWYERQQVNAQQAIFHQWRQLEASGCIENFRIAAGLSDGLREGWFFADSDAYKWLDAAVRILRDRPDPHLAELADGFIDLLARAQMPDGYLFTYNQIHFPGVRWRNLQIEHELYCHGHLIEAGVSHFEASGRTDLLAVARRAADRIVADFRGQGAAYTPGHEEIEIALLRLHAITPGDTDYLGMARQFLERRGRAWFLGVDLFRQLSDSNRRLAFVKQQKQDYRATHPDFKPFELPPGNKSIRPGNIMLRWYVSVLNGKYFQQHAPIRRQCVPEGHAVRFAYLETATAMLARATGDRSLLPALEAAWERMVTRRMYVTGGIGSLPVLEGFGNDDELDPEYAYAETCAALGSLFWNWQMAQITGAAKYSDLFEWQLYNAAAVGMGLDGTGYLYNNPLACRGGVTRKPWYAVPCCPSNLSRTWADLGGYIYTNNADSLSVHQYISSSFTDGPLNLEMRSELPWQGHVRLTVKAVRGPEPVALRLRLPAWAAGMRTRVNAQPAEAFPLPVRSDEPTDAGYDPRKAVFVPLERAWSVGDVVEIDFDMPVRLLRAHPRVKGHDGRVAVTRGPLVYCLEDCDNLGVDLFDARLDPESLSWVEDEALLGGIVKLVGRTVDGQALTFIPYFLWGNRGPSQMTVWVKEG
ncbi:putative glycosyl hydrolase [Longilinea arvoryzae]|uniref:Putative glycosyl hydrolase n=1 Tax=Longilinea arvoryzae TaxID=360412 RepID=A0A0S7BGR4_9CHLR|nr:beta-L-arabinofuranosidase domain-containing protein [Longilinea arvoryzae]GAP13019.1 putative glycosyl hydrolase [Longilinea arvoryzae]